MSMKKLDRLVERMYEIIEKALNRACPMKTVTSKVKQNKWATEKHTDLKKEVTAMYMKAKQSKSEQDWATYRAKDKDFKSIKKAFKQRKMSPRW